MKAEKTRRRAVALIIKNLGLKKGEYILCRERLFVLRPGMEERLAKTFGISSWSKGYLVEREIEQLKRIVVQLLAARRPKSFKIETQRMDKSYPYSSLELNKILGSAAVETLGLKVDLEQPEVIIYVEILRRWAFVADNKHRGLGGLPYGFSGKCVVLLSGGIDSPVAAWLAMKRGCRLLPLHFVVNREEEKIERLVDVLSSYGRLPRPVFVEHAAWLEETKKLLKIWGAERYVCVLCKRRMLKVAAQYCRKEGAQAIVTGDSLGQVASQTLRNLACEELGCPYPVLRPLIGLDKEEIVELAKKIGTYEISISGKHECPYAPRHPIINPDKKKVMQLEELLKKEGLDLHEY